MFALVGALLVGALVGDEAEPVQDEPTAAAAPALRLTRTAAPSRPTRQDTEEASTLEAAIAPLTEQGLVDPEGARSAQAAAVRAQAEADMLDRAAADGHDAARLRTLLATLPRETLAP